jgi:hypothetical protein
MERAIVVLSNDGSLLCAFSGWYGGAQSVEIFHRQYITTRRDAHNVRSGWTMSDRKDKKSGVFDFSLNPIKD